MELFFKRSNAKELAELAQGETQLTDAASKPGEKTVSFHFEITTKLGWIQWRDREATLFTLFERAFAATRCELKISDSLDEFSMEVEIPIDQEDKFTKAFKGKELTREIDRLHVPSSCENLQQRLERLEQCSNLREKEVDGLKEMTRTLIQETKRKVELLESRIDCKVYEKCGAVFDKVESRIMQILREDLLFMGVPSGFKHPEDAAKTDTGVKALIKVLHQTAKKPPSPSPIKARVNTPVNIQYLEEASRLNLFHQEESIETPLVIEKRPLLNQPPQSSLGKPFVYTNAESPQEVAPKEPAIVADLSPEKVPSLMSSPTPIEIRQLSQALLENSQSNSAAKLDLPPLPAQDEGIRAFEAVSKFE